MRFFKLKRARSRVHHTQRYPLYAVLSVLLVLSVALTIVTVSKQREHDRLMNGQRQLATQIQSNLNIAMASFEKTSLPGSNLSGDILPTMRLHLYAAGELNEVMIETFGRDSSMIDEQIYQQIDMALNQIERSISEGRSTDSDRETLRVYMEQMETDLNARFAGTELLMTRDSLR